MHPEDSKRSAQYLTKLVSAARAVIAFEVALPQGCVRLAKVLYWLQPLEELDYPVFQQYLEETALQACL